MSTPLADVRILAIEQFGAGPWATLQLADLGADVVKIEDPSAGGDVSRSVPPFQEGEDSLFFETFNRGKRSISLDLRTDAGRAAFEALVPAVDAVFSNLRGDLPERLRITYADLAPLNPRIVCCSLSGFGATGPRAREGGYDPVLQGLAGWMALTGEPDGPPTKSGLSLVDFSAGYVAAIALLGGLWRARREGVGCDCDISLFETALAQLTYHGTWAATEGFRPRRMADSAHQTIVPFQLFASADGHVVVACAKQHLWERLCHALGRPELIDDERYADFAGRDRNREPLLATLREAFAARTTEEWLRSLADAGVPCGPVNDVEAALADPQAQARDAVVRVEHPNLGTVREIASPLRLSGEVRAPTRGPLRGEHTREVLEELAGLPAEQVAELARRDAFGTTATWPPRRELTNEHEDRTA